VSLASHVRRPALVLALAALVTLFALASSAGAVGRKTMYGKPGAVQLVDVKGARDATTKEISITFPMHTFRRSAAAPRDPQKVCTTYKISVPATAPATGWVVAATSKAFCATLKPGQYARIGDWPWKGGAVATDYHAQYTVTWSTKKKKKLAAATYDFNTVEDYDCTSLNCIVQKDAANVPYFTFFAS
jgi:hypothetical protein